MKRLVDRLTNVLKDTIRRFGSQQQAHTRGTGGTGPITTSLLADKAVTNPKIADNAVNTRTLASLSVTNDKIADQSILLSKLNVPWLSVAGNNNFKDALNKVTSAGGGVLVLPKGNYSISDNVTVNENVTLHFMNGAVLVIDSGKTLTISGSIEAGLYQIFDGAGAVNGNMKVGQVYAQWFGAKADGVNDDTNAVEKALQFLDRRKGGLLFLSAGTYLLRNLYLRSLVTVLGTGNGTILKLKNGTNGNLVSLKDNSVMQFRISNLLIDGNKSNNVSGSGIYINKTSYVYSDVVKQGNYSDMNSSIEDVFIFECADHGIYIDRTDTSDNFINIRGIYCNNVQVISCGKTGIKLNQNTDGRFCNIISTGNGYSGFEIQGCANNYYLNCKTFYNGFNSPTNNYGGFVITNSGRSSFVGCEAQEEYKYGFYVSGGNMLVFSACYGDSNGQQNSTYSGFYFKNNQLSNLIGCTGTSFHTPSWQYTGFTFEDCSAITAILSVNNQLSRSNYILKGTNTKMKLTVNGEVVL
ncbi:MULTISPECIES: right-handed parallel beta-helix repeat-containing protein [Paenibacillus]|uniref:Rhamnogalacturonase A/B/Epimerase-like pectate lyase domain-containing protein n=1 Tax=Paenibacillus albilobatus TaxID=2716884 RepID=A0A920CAJ2_9BACL|nr:MULTISPECIES: right-handed parallel beta-helix repeat-containing protein [Paenibacillus]GIO30129.1 hypothetical protein J2TS6_12700 [Paenibacillus albilobatus]